MKALVTPLPHLERQLWGPGSEPGRAPSLSPLSQYSATLEQELQNLKVDMESLDLLSPAGLRDLTALQSSGLSNIHYPDFLIQVSSGPSGQTAAEQRGPQRSWRGASRLILALHLLPTPQVPAGR